MQRFEAVNLWLRDDLLPGLLVVLGGILLVRVIRWIETQYNEEIDKQIRAAIERNDVASEQLKRSRAIVQAVGWATAALAYMVILFLAVRALGVPLATLIAPAAVAGVAIGFGAQQVVGDLLAGFFLFAEHQFGFGDIIRFSQPGQTMGVTGVVEELNLRVTKLRTSEGELVIIPNGSLRQVTNLSKEWSRAVLDVPIAVGEDLERATGILRAAGRGMTDDEPWANLLLDEPAVAGVQSYEVGFVRLRVVARTLPGRQFEVARELRLRCATALTDAGIASPPVELPGSSMGGS
jgi:moderate conductance mechanosensitive channel